METVKQKRVHQDRTWTRGLRTALWEPVDDITEGLSSSSVTVCVRGSSFQNNLWVFSPPGPEGHDDAGASAPTREPRLQDQQVDLIPEQVSGLQDQQVDLIPEQLSGPEGSCFSVETHLNTC